MAEFNSDGTVAKLSQADTTTAYGSATFDTLGQVTAMSLPGIERALIDVTDLSDTDRKALLGIADNTAGTLTVNWDPNTASAIAYAKAAVAAGEERWLEITLSDTAGTTIYWPVLVNMIGNPEVSEGDKVTCTIGFKAQAGYTIA